MKRIKKVDLKKLTIDTTTIRILSDVEQAQAAGGISGVWCSDGGGEGCGIQTRNRTCSCAPGTGCR